MRHVHGAAAMRCAAAHPPRRASGSRPQEERVSAGQGVTFVLEDAQLEVAQVGKVGSRCRGSTPGPAWPAGCGAMGLAAAAARRRTSCSTVTTTLHTSRSTRRTLPCSAQTSATRRAGVQARGSRLTPGVLGHVLASTSTCPASHCAGVTGVRAGPDDHSRLAAVQGGQGQGHLRAHAQKHPHFGEPQGVCTAQRGPHAHPSAHREPRAALQGTPTRSPPPPTAGTAGPAAPHVPALLRPHGAAAAEAQRARNQRAGQAAQGTRGHAVPPLRVLHALGSVPGASAPRGGAWVLCRGVHPPTHSMPGCTVLSR